MNVLFNMWEPGVTDGVHTTSAAGGGWIPALFDYLEGAGCRIINPSVGADDLRFDEVAEAMNYNPDVIVLMWRWPMHSDPIRHSAWNRQNFWLNYAAATKTPVLISDQDLKGNAADFATSLRASGVPVKLTMPAFRPPSGYETLHFPSPQPLDAPVFECDMKRPSERPYIFSYIGNNYERYEIMKETWGGEDKGHGTNIWGNWLEPSDSRETPEQVQSDFPNTLFHGRLPQTEVFDVLGDSMYTHHFAKEEYNSYGFMTIRWAEAAAANCLAYCDANFSAPDILANNFSPKSLSVDNDAQYLMALNAQRAIVNQVQRPEPWLEALVDLIS